MCFYYDLSIVQALHGLPVVETPFGFLKAFLFENKLSSIKVTPSVFKGWERSRLALFPLEKLDQQIVNHRKG